MKRIADVAVICRSKNAGPFLLTLDIVFPTSEVYRSVVDAEVISPKSVAALYSVDEHDVRVLQVPLATAIKIVIPRLTSAGDIGDTDVYGAQQHVPLMDIEIPG
jgi:Domain of unknown function (DUF4387)